MFISKNMNRILTQLCLFGFVSKHYFKRMKLFYHNYNQPKKNLLISKAVIDYFCNIKKNLLPI